MTTTSDNLQAHNSSDSPFAGQRPNTKVVVLLGLGLEMWQELNVTSFLMSGISTSEPGLTGEDYVDADGTRYTPMLTQPVFVMSAEARVLASARKKAVARGDVAVAIYTRELFSTGNDIDNRAAVATVFSDDLDLVGVALRGPRNAVDRMIKGARFHD